MEKLLDHYWHDAVLHEVLIDRRSPGHKDSISLLIEWPDWDAERRGTKSRVEFEDCYSIEINMNCGVTCQESIRSADFQTSHPKLNEIRGRCAIGDKLHCFVLETNSTASTIKIFATAYQVFDQPDQGRAD